VHDKAVQKAIELCRNRELLTNRSESPIVLDRIRDLLAADPEVEAVGRLASVYVGPHQLLVTAELKCWPTGSPVRGRPNS